MPHGAIDCREKGRPPGALPLICALATLLCISATPLGAQSIPLPPPAERIPLPGAADWSQGTSRLPPIDESLVDAHPLQPDWPLAVDRELLTPSAAPEPWPHTSLSAAWLAGGSDGFGTADFDLNHSWDWFPARGGEPVIVALGGGLHLWSGPPDLALPSRVYDLYLDLSWRFLDRPGWGLAGGITPGFYGDFERWDGDAFQLTGWLLGDWALGEEWTLVAGVAYVRQLESNLLPVGGLVWRPSPDVRLDLVVPRPRIARRWFQGEGRDAWIYLAGQFGGGAWAVEDGGENVLVQYSDLRLGLGLEIARADGPIATVELGYAFSRDISVDRFTASTPPDTFYMQGSWAF